MDSKTVTFMNNSRNPVKMRNSSGKEELVLRGQTVTVLAGDAPKIAKRFGFIDLSKAVKNAEEKAESKKADGK